MATEEPTFDGYDFAKGQPVRVDWSDGRGPQDTITGRVTDINQGVDGVLVGVTDYKSEEFKKGRTYDCAPEWIEPRPFPEGQRVILLDQDGEIEHYAGTVLERDGETYLLDVDGLSGPWHGLEVPREQLRAVGCEECDETGFTAERREGITYPVPCHNCGDKTGRYWWSVSEFKLTTVV